MNSVNLIGRVGRDPEIRHTSTGKAVCEFSLAVDDGWGDNKKTVWLDVTAWNATAETCSAHVVKGDKLGITGRLSQDEWTDKATGQKRTKIKITADSIHFAGAKRESGQHQQRAATPGPRQGYQGGAAPPRDNGGKDYPDDDSDSIPFAPRHSFEF